MTSEELFFLYAYPCAGIRHDSGKIDGEQYAKLQQVKEGERPISRGLLKWCFPSAFKSIRTHAAKTGLDAWSIENIADYWRHGHGHTGLCRVLKVRVINIDLEGRIFVEIPEEGQHIALNPFSYDPVVGDVYYMHQKCLTEKADI